MRWAGRLVVGAVVMVATAGSCQQEWDGPLPSPDELGAQPLPHPPGGIDATYAVDIGAGAGGTRCYRILALAGDGAVTESALCTSGAVADALDDAGEPTAAGDYSYRDGEVRVRMVSWDSLAEELVLDEYDATVCGTEYRAAAVFELVAGTPPTTSSTTPACPER